MSIKQSFGVRRPRGAFELGETALANSKAVTSHRTPKMRWIGREPASYDYYRLWLTSNI